MSMISIEWILLRRRIIFFSPQPIILIQRLLIQRYLSMNPGLTIICGMGSKGCALGTIKEIQFFKALELDLPVVDTNGAGDSLAVGFLSSYVLEGLPLDESILRGQIAARYKCGIKASSSSLITRELLAHYREKFG